MQGGREGEFWIPGAGQELSTVGGEVRRREEDGGVEEKQRKPLEAGGLSLFWKQGLCRAPREKVVGTLLSRRAQGVCQTPEQKWLSTTQGTDSLKAFPEVECVRPACECYNEPLVLRSAAGVVTNNPQPSAGLGSKGSRGRLSP